VRSFLLTSSSISCVADASSCLAESNREVVQIVFAYLELLKSTPVRRSTFDEIQALGKIAWTNKEQSSSAAATVNYTASLLQESQAPRDQLFISPYFATEFNPQLIQETLSHLRRDNCRIFIGSQEPLEGRVWTETEQYYSTEYETRKLDLKVLFLAIRLLLRQNLMLH
jgi:insulysin